MKFGIYLPNFGAYGDARVLANLAQDAENSGWDGFFIWDHIAGWTLPMVDPWVALAAVAVSTHRIRIGTTVTPLPRRRPWKLAREAVSIDHLSGGRLTLGVGIGGGKAEWAHLGEQPDLKKRGAMLDEALSVLVGLWSGEPFSYAGQYYHIENAHFLPKPLQQPHIPIWVGGIWPNKAPFRRAAKWDGAFPLFEVEENEQELAQLDDMVRYLSKHRKHEQPLEIIIMGVTADAESKEVVNLVEQRADLGATWWLESITPFRSGKGYEDEWPVDSMRERILQGPPQLRKPQK
ncbi:MAG: TIGR03619 family F420-dependent LLM class oxidoreductase [Anaerolineales bacterium]|nr:TIGR03619 family F420-dependent LLM class oxidoreductase [Anaerolineales bacterium]